MCYASMRAMGNETAKENENCLLKESGNYKKQFEVTKSTRRERYLYYGEKAETK